MEKYLIVDKNCEPIVVRLSRYYPYVIYGHGAADDVVRILRRINIPCKAIFVEDAVIP